MLPAEEYRRRLQERETSAAYHDKIHYRCGNFRLATFLCAVVIAWESLHAHRFSAWWLAVPAAAFLALAAFHSRVLRRRDLARRAVAFYENGLARIEDRWKGTGPTGERFADPHHVYSADLDLFGHAGLFQLLSTARTRMGEDRLAAWLLAPSSVRDIQERQGAIAELRNEINFREDLAIIGEDAGVGVHPEELREWANADNRMRWPRLWPLAIMLALLFLLSVGVWIAWGTITPMLVITLIEAAIMFRLRKAMEGVLHGAQHALRDLELLSGTLERMEQQVFQSPRLVALQHELISGQIGASSAIARLRTIGDLIDSRDNMFVRVFDIPLMYSVQVALAAERWRAVHGSRVRAWLDNVAELEALLSLAAYCYEHPADSFPQFVQGKPSFQAKELGHPLLPALSCVRNNVQLCGETQALLISGSNMSGKSTLLRAIGINVVLAMAGAPIRAQSMRLTPLQTGASIRINDSLQEGSSRFYAEITRLRKLFDLAGSEPRLLFLLDELLQGTNSADRRVGAEGIVRSLLARGAIGLLTTHDLALTEIAAVLNGQLRNLHFEDEFRDGRMIFDYRLREGVVTKSNGLALMRSVGLDV